MTIDCSYIEGDGELVHVNLYHQPISDQAVENLPNREDLRVLPVLTFVELSDARFIRLTPRVCTKTR